MLPRLLPASLLTPVAHAPLANHETLDKGVPVRAFYVLSNIACTGHLVALKRSQPLELRDLSFLLSYTVSGP